MAGEASFNFNENLKARRRSMGPSNRSKTKDPREILWLYPFADEKKYERLILKQIINPLINSIIPVIRENIDNWKRAARGDSLNVKLDDWIDELEQILRDMGVETTSIFGEEGEEEGTELWASIVILAGITYAFNRKQWNKQTKQILGFEYETDESWWEESRKAWAKENYNMLKNYSRDYQNRIREITYRGIRNQTLTRDIIKELQKEGDRLKNKAKLLARDQIGKLNGKITQLRQEEVGIEIYKWRTALDERVRGNPAGRYPKAVPSHFIMEGTWNRWDNSSVYADPNTDVIRNEDGTIKKVNWKPRTGKMPIAIPGEEIQCFSGNVPVLSPVMAEKLYRRWFTGKLARFVMKNGSIFECTLNHPILRSDGRMITAKILNVGDYIFHIPDDRIDTFFETDKNNRIASFKELFEFFSIIGIEKRTSNSVHDFHGDSIVDQDINIISLERKLRNSTKALIDKGVFDLFLSHANMSLSFLSGDTAFNFMCKSLGFSYNNFISFLSKLFPLLDRHSTILDSLRIRTASKLNAIFEKAPFNQITRDIILTCNIRNKSIIDIFFDDDFFRYFFFVMRYSVMMKKLIVSNKLNSLGNIISVHTDDFGYFCKIKPYFVHADNIIDKRIIKFNGYVYNLQNKYGWYSITDKNIVVKNCRCTGIPVWEPVISDIDKEIK